MAQIFNHIIELVMPIGMYQLSKKKAEIYIKWNFSI